MIMITTGKYEIIDNNNTKTVWQMNVKSVNRKTGTLMADWFMVGENKEPYTIRDRNDDISAIQGLFNNGDWTIKKIPDEHFEKDLFSV